MAAAKRLVCEDHHKFNLWAGTGGLSRPPYPGKHGQSRTCLCSSQAAPVFLIDTPFEPGHRISISYLIQPYWMRRVNVHRHEETTLHQFKLAEIAMYKMVAIALRYFCIVFGAGLVLGTVRVLFLADWLGERNAELAEMPFMLAVIALAARHQIAKHGVHLTRLRALAMGIVALAVLLAVEFTVVLELRHTSVAEHLGSRDPVSGLAYIAGLLFYALAPLAFYLGRTK